MIQKSEGIVLGHIAYGDTSIIARIYSREFGYQSFIVNSVRSARSRQGMAFFQPFSVLDMVIYMKPNRDLHRISEFKLIQGNQSTDIQKQTVFLFLAEVLDKLLRSEQTENHELFDFLKDAITAFQKGGLMPNFHIQLLLKITSFLGFMVTDADDLFENMNRVSDYEALEKYISLMISEDFQTQIESSGELRRQALEVLIQYFQHHQDGFGRVHSLKVLSQIFR